MAEACLDSNSNPSTPKFSHRTYPPGLNSNGISGGAPDYLAQALRRMNSVESVSSVGSNLLPLPSPLSIPLSPHGMTRQGQAPSAFFDNPNPGYNMGMPNVPEAWALG